MEEGWERPPRVELSAEQLADLIEPAFPGKAIAETSVLAHGLANTNLRFRLQGSADAYVLRLHTRERAAARRERALMNLLAHGAGPAVPVARLIYSDAEPERGQHPYSIWSFVEGTLLSELFPQLPPEQLVEIARECGRVLARLRQYSFAACGQFGAELEIARDYGRPSRFVPDAVRQALFDGRAGDRLGAALRDDLWRLVERAAPRLTVIDDRYSLVHCDYKRSNLLLLRSGGSWAVSAVLDWEFAFAGPPLIDVGLFLRAGAALPAGFREAFVAGYRAGGGELPEDWLPLSRLIDVLSQLTFLNDASERPRVFAETTEVVKETIGVLARWLTA
ncbi:MAG TPA: aminoglycoside phosphotransferase family protein [Polyangiaceae bacterium]|nr:aminoglycoside phosphotransferase family protein [Polyangiaceae bacterium]